MKAFNYLTKTRWLVTIILLLTLGIGQMWGYTYTRLESIAGIDANAVYVLGINGTGFHYSGTSSWGLTALPANQTPYYYTLTPNNNNTSFTAQTKISNTTYYLQVPTSNTFSMSTATGTNTTLIIGTTQSNAGNDKGYAVANSGTTNRHLRRNGSSGLRSYAGNTGSLAFFYKVCCPNPTSLTNGEITSNTAHLSWTDAANTNKYEVYISTSSTAPGSDATPTATVTDQKYADITSGLSTSTTYNWWVRAKDKNNSAITSDWVAGTAFTTTSGASCAVDPTVSASSNGSVTCTSATITCNNGSSKGVVKGSCDISEWGFVYGTSGSPTGNKTSVGTNSSTDVANFSHTFTGLTPGQTYYFRAYAIVNGTTYYGSQTNFTCKTITVTANNGSYGSVSGSGLSWTATPNSGYVFADPAYTITAGNNTSVNQVGNTFTITSTSSVEVTITINFEAKNCTDHGASSITGGTSTGHTYGPVSNYYNYSARQILYTKSDLGLAAGKKGTIKSIYFQYAYATAMSKKTSVKIYLANTTLTELSTSSYVPFASFTEVYEGPLNCSGDGTWNEFIFNKSNFDYDGIGNLAVLIDDNSNGYDGTSGTFVFKYHDSETDGIQLYYNVDGSNPDPSSSSTWTGATPTSNRPNTKFCIQEADMTPATVTLMDNSATLTEASAGAGVTLPARAGCSGYTFAGWTKSWVAAQTSWTTTAPTIIPAGSYTPAGNENLYPVYTKTEGGGSGFKLSLNSGGTDYYIGAKGSGAYMSAVTDAANAVVFTYADSHLSYDNSGTKTYISSDGDNTTLTVGTSSPSSTWTESGTSTYTYQSSATGTRYLAFNSSANPVRFAPYGSSYAHEFTKHALSTTYYISVPDCCDMLAAPENPGETPNSTGAVLTWDAVTGATGYEVNIDNAGWVSTSNGTTTGYTITGKTCGGTTVTWQVRATGSGSNCAAGTATTVRNFNTTSCACSYYSFHYQHGSDWNTDNICFTPVSDGSNDYLTAELSLPYAEWYNVCWQGVGQSYTATKGFTGTTNNIPMKFYHNTAQSFGANPQAGNLGGGLGRFHVVHNSNNTNKDVTFVPTGYTLNFGSGDDPTPWTNDATLNFTGKTNNWNETEWYTPMTTVTEAQIGKKIFVGLKTSSGYVWCDPYSRKDNLSGLRTKSGSGDNWVTGGLTTSYPNKTGKFRIYADSGDKNWYVTFVPHYQLTYNANGGTGTMNPLPETPVSCEETLANRTVTVGACTFAAPSHKEFKEWNTQADGNGTTIATGSRELTGDLKLYAIWKNESYSISATMTNVTSVTSFPVTYTYTGSAANVTYTFAAASGYRLPDNVTVTGSTYTWDQATGQLTLTGIITGAVSITVTAVQTHTIHWLVNGVDYTGKSPVTVDHGSSLTFPTPNPSAPGACDSKTFVGWTSDSEITTETNTAPTLISEGTAVDGDATYRAVFADVTGYPDKFKRVTQLSDISEGSQIAIGFYVTSNIKLCGLDFNGWTTYSCATGVTEDGNSRIDKPSAANTWNVSKSGNYWVFTNAGDGSTKMGIGTTSSNNPLDPASTTYYKWEIGANSSGTNHFYLRLYDGSAMTYCALELYQSTWKIYDVTSSGTHVYSSSAYTALKLYVPAGTRTNYITQCSSCTTPSSVTASDVTNNSATISWSGVSQTQQVGGSGTGFTVLWGTDATRANNSNTANVAAGTTTYNLTGLSEGTHYYVWVQSKCDDSWCATPADFTTLVSHTATFYDVDGTTPLQSGSVIEGSAITYSGSTPVSCDAGVDASTTFVGWASAPWSSKLAKGSIPSTFYDIVGGESLPNMGNSNMSFYPVFAKATGDPLTNHAWTYTFSAQTYKANDTKTLAGTEGGNTVNADWELLTYNQSSVAITNWGSFDNDRGSKIGKNDDDYVTYMYLSSASFDGTITAVKISTSGNSGVTANVSATVGGTTFYNGVNSSLDISSSNAEYSFTGSKAISGDDEVVFIWEQESAKALYIKKIEVDYTTGGSITYSNYMTTCSQCTTPSGLEASSITEAGATITWSGTSNSETTGFKVLWSTNSTRPAPASGNNGDTNAETKTYSISGLNAGTTYYVWVQSKCDGSWSSSINFTTKAIHAITLTADNGTIVGGSPINVVDGATLTFPNVTGTSCGSFVGWTTGDYDNVAAPATLYANGAEKANITADESYKALYRTASGAETNVTDNWTGTKIGVSIYDDWSGKVDASAAVYAGNSTKNSSYSNCLQLRSTNNSGIITTTSGGKAKKVTVTWNSNTTNSNTLDVYGKNTAYSAVSDLYNNDANVKGTKIGSIVKGTSTELTIDGDYAYIGVRSNSGALYIDNLAIEWYGLPMKYTTAPDCDPMVSMTSSFSTFSYVYAAGPSSSQSFTVSGIQLGADLVVTAPANYEVCKTADGTYTSSVSYTPTDGAVAATVYIRLAAGLNVGTYNYVAASGVAVTSTGATTANAALNGTVTKADCAIIFTDFNAVDHYEGVLEYGSSVTVSYNYTYPGDGTFSITHSPNTGTFNKTDKTLTVSVAGIWTLNASATAGSNYNKPANASAEIRVKCVDTYVDFIHNKTIKAYGSGSTVTDGKMEDWGSGYTVPYIDDNATETSGSCQQTHFKFVGWVSEDDINIADGTFKPGYTLIEAGTAEKRATTKTYYAVWAKQEE